MTIFLSLTILKTKVFIFVETMSKFFATHPLIFPTEKKIIAIDDIDELSDVSQQVICNCLNKFPNNVICIATCNNSLKVFNGLKSRMAFVSVFPPSHNKLLTICTDIIEREKIQIEPNIINLLVESSNSSYKTLLNTLQKLKILDAPINQNNIYELITSINFKTFNDFFTHLIHKNLQAALDTVFDIVHSGISVIDILFEFFIYIKDKKNTLSDEKKYEIIKCISKYMTIFNNIHEDTIEIAFFTNELYLLF